jgi:hypothetical protein
MTRAVPPHQAQRVDQAIPGKQDPPREDGESDYLAPVVG